MTVLEESHEAGPSRSGDDRPEGRNDDESTGREASDREEMNSEHDADRQEANTVHFRHVTTARHPPRQTVLQASACGTTRGLARCERGWRSSGQPLPSVHLTYSLQGPNVPEVHRPFRSMLPSTESWSCGVGLPKSSYLVVTTMTSAVDTSLLSRRSGTIGGSGVHLEEVGSRGEFRTKW